MIKRFVTFSTNERYRVVTFFQMSIPDHVSITPPSRATMPHWRRYVDSHQLGDCNVLIASETMTWLKK